MPTVEVRTQAELDAALARADAETVVACVGDGWFRVGESSHVVARGSSHVEAWGSSHVEAWESSHVVAWGSSHVVAWGSSHVVARGSSHVEAWGSSHVEATDYVAVHRHGDTPEISGGVLIQVPDIATAEQWLDWHGLKPDEQGVVVLYKAVREDWASAHGTSYAPGETPEAPDWDGGEAECGGGLHFSFHPQAAKSWDSAATRYVGCPVLFADIVVHSPANYPDKIKAPRVAPPGCFEVDERGAPILPREEATS